MTRCFGRPALFSVALGLMCFATFSPSVRIFSPGPSARLERAERQILRIQKETQAEPARAIIV
jgi:uncharacterized protein (DUF58 family)